MSRIGKQPIHIPDSVDITIDGSLVRVKGDKGELSYTLPNGVSVEEKDDSLIVSVKENTKQFRALWGTARSILSSMVKGVNEGYQKQLELRGVGYRAKLKGDTLVLSVGFSHPVEIDSPEEISFSVEDNIITVSGIDKQLVGEIAAKIRAVRKPEPYKGKGIRYKDEHVRRKAGKKAAATDEAGAI